MRKLLSLAIGLVLLPALAQAEPVTITVVNHRAIGTRVIRFYGYPCSLDGQEHSDLVTTSATYSCDTGVGPEGQNHRKDMLSISSPKGVQMCDVTYRNQPWIDGFADQSEAYNRAHTRPPGMFLSQQTPSGRSDDRTRAGCALTQTGPNAYQVDTTVASGWLGDEY